MIVDPYERWLLDMVVELSYPLDVLGDPEIELALNRAGHGLPPTEIASRVHRLVEAGWIELVEIAGDVQRPVTLSASELVRCVQASGPARLGDGVYFALTSEGGAAWEELARPDWTRLIVDIYDGDGTTVNALDRARVEAFLRETRGEARGTRDAEVWTELAPWQATYWKQMPRGTSCRIAAGLDAPLDFTDGRGERLDELRRWFHRVELSTS